MEEPTKKCKDCQSDIPKNAKRCPNCTADQRSWFARHPIVTTFLVLIGVFYIIGSIGSDSSSAPATGTTNTEAQPATTNSDTTAPENTNTAPHPAWKYENKTDEFSDINQSYAYLTSTNELDFDFPYNGGSKFILVVRNLGKGLGEEVLMKVDKGQFMTYDEYIQVRFDDGEAIRYNINGPQDGSADTIFIKNATGFIANLQGSTSIKIEAPFYQEGRKVIYFDTAGYNGLQ